MEEKEVLVKVEGLSKKFCKDLKTSLWYGVKDLFSGITGKHNNGLLRPKEFWAVKDISFELRRGECLGLIGHNGAGKSTLLKILNGLINPDEGKVTIRGKVGALIELGAGFNPILSGRENIYNNGAVLGFTKAEIDNKVEEIIEVLAVGDMGFAMKSFNAISQLLKTSAVIFVSHSMPFISRICNNIILMEKGEMLLNTDNVGLGIQSYFSRQKQLKSLNFGDENITLNKVKIYSENPNSEGIIEYGEKSIYEINIDSLNVYPKVKVAILVYNMAQINVALYESRNISIKAEINQTFIFDFGDSYLSISNYFITVRFDCFEDNKSLVVSNYVNYRSFQVTGDERLVFAPLYLIEKK